MSIELRTIEGTCYAFLAHNRWRLHWNRDLHRVRHLLVRTRDRFEAHLRRREIGVGDLCLETEHRRRVALRRLGYHIATEQFHVGIRDTPRRDSVVVGKILPNNGAQFNFIAVAQETRQSQVDQERL